METKNVQKAQESEITNAQRRRPVDVYQIDGWIHPLNGGDDYQFSKTLTAPFLTTQHRLKNFIKESLRQVSATDDDFEVKYLYSNGIGVTA